MDDIASEFRASRLELLEFIASPDMQSAFALRVSYADYASEFYCWWFDDFHPSSDLFQQAFLASELEVLCTFSTKWEKEDLILGQVDRSIKELLLNCSWRSVMEAAKNALIRFTDSAA